MSIRWVWAAVFTRDGTGLLTGGGGIQYDTPGEDFKIRQWDLSKLLPESGRPSGGKAAANEGRTFASKLKKVWFRFDLTEQL